MTTKEIAARDLVRAARNLEFARKKPNVQPDEIKHLEELLEARREIARAVGAVKEG